MTDVISGQLVGVAVITKHRVTQTIKKILPWAIAALIFYWLFSKIDPQQILEATRAADMVWFSFYAVAYFFVIHILDCAAIKHFISRFAAPISHRESWIVRGVTYLIMVVNYHAAQGAFAVYFKKTHGAPLAKSLGTMLFVSLIDLIIVLGCAFVGASLGGATGSLKTLGPILLILVPVSFICFTVWAWFWKNLHLPVLQKLTRFRLYNGLIHHDTFFIFREASRRDYLAALLYRVPINIVSIGAFNLALWAFGTHLSWHTLFLYNPIIIIFGTLPITPAGLGTSQVLFVEFFKDSVPATTLVASSLLWMIANQLIKLVVGAASLAFTSRKLLQEDS